MFGLYVGDMMGWVVVLVVVLLCGKFGWVVVVDVEFYEI